MQRVGYFSSEILTTFDICGFTYLQEILGECIKTYYGDNNNSPWGFNENEQMQPVRIDCAKNQGHWFESNPHSLHELTDGYPRIHFIII